MYATCTFCHGALGRNESIEVFPVGRRLAYDASKGRLWVVCTHCAQWNLSPLEERWEAIEGAERLFRASRLRHSTDNIGLAKLADNTELIRIGNPLRPEMATWRYGQNFVRRWKNMAAGLGVGAATIGGAAVLFPAPGFLLGAGSAGVAFAVIAAQMFRMGGKVAFLGQFVRDNEQQYVRVVPKTLGLVRLISHESGWALRIPCLSRRPTVELHLRDIVDVEMGSVVISGQPAVTAARQLLPLINGWGARKSVVDDAVTLASSWGSADKGFAQIQSLSHELARKQLFGDPGALNYLPAPMRLGLEMSLHESEEQRVLEGELAELEQSWKDAEVIAGISDGMFVSGRVERLINKLRG